MTAGSGFWTERRVLVTGATGKGEIRNQYLSPAKAAEVLGWKPAYTLEEGLKETVDWYAKFWEKP